MEDYKKKYEDLVEHIKHFHQSVNPDWKRIIESYVPELKETSDELIREELIIHLKQERNSAALQVNREKFNSMITWVKKQGEKKRIDKVEPKFKVGDWIYHEVSGNTIHINKIENDLYVSDEGATISLGRQNNWRIWTIKDGKDGEILATGNGGICIFDGTVEEGIYPFAYCGLTRHHGFEVYDRKLPFTHDNDIHPATKEDCDLLFSKMKEAGYEWDSEKKELRKIEKKPETKDDVLSRFAFYQYDNEILYLSSVFVRDSSRKHGYGSKILKAAEEVARTFGISKIRLKVERNTWVEEWYKKNGYEYLSSEGKYDWLENRVIDIKPDNIEQNYSSWSEEDERIYKVVLEILNSWSKGTIGGSIIPPCTDRYINWLNSLKCKFIKK